MERSITSREPSLFVQVFFKSSTPVAWRERLSIDVCCRKCILRSYGGFFEDLLVARSSESIYQPQNCFQSSGSTIIYCLSRPYQNFVINAPAKSLKTQKKVILVKGHLFDESSLQLWWWNLQNLVFSDVFPTSLLSNVCSFGQDFQSPESIFIDILPPFWRKAKKWQAITHLSIFVTCILWVFIPFFVNFQHIHSQHMLWK